MRHPPRRRVERRPPATRTAAPRRGTATCSRSWTSGSSRAASNSGEKWRRPHDDREDEPGDDRECAARRTTRECRTGRISVAPRLGEATRRSSVIGAAERDERRRDEHQQEVLDHVDREQGRVVAVDPDSSAKASASMPAEERHGPPPRHRVGGVGRVDPADGPEPPDQARRTMPSVGSGSNVQPRERGRDVGGSAGAGAVGAATGPAQPARRAASQPQAAARRPPDRRRGIGGIVARTRRTAARPHARSRLTRSTTPRSGVEWPRFDRSGGRMRRLTTGRRAPSGRAAPSSRTLMSSSPRTRPSPTAIFALARRRRRPRLIAGAHRGSGQRRRRREFVTSLFPPIAVTDAGRARSATCTTIVFVDRGRDLPRRRRADHLDRPPLPAQAGRRRRCRRRPTATTSPSSSGRVVPTLIVVFMFVISWQTLNAVEADLRERRRPGSARSPASSSGSSTTCRPTDATERRRTPSCSRLAEAGRRDVRAGRPDRPAVP